MSVDLLTTLDLFAALKTALVAIPHPTLVAPAKLFEVVDYHEDKNLAEALEELIIIKKRVCLIVLNGDRYENDKQGRSVRSRRTTSLDIVMADQAYTQGGQAAAFGGPSNVGVVAMKDLVVATLGEQPQLTNLRWCQLTPTEGAMLALAADEQKKAPGRQAYVLNYETPSGELILPATEPWPAQS
ncbi:MAG: hypothetical protein Q8J78_07375 [Moraxellaceae bacterium]|nr:hypothetical protein [Moraxellaceae bacterium]